MQTAEATIINRVEDLSQKKGWPMSHVAFSWIRKRVASPIIGFSSVERIDELLAAGHKELTAEEEAYLEEPYIPKVVSGHD